MKITEFMAVKRISLNLKGATKSAVIDELGALMNGCPSITDCKCFIKDVHEREKLGTTGIGCNVAIPHARSEHANSIAIAVGLSRQGVDFASLDGKKVNVVFLTAIPLKEVNNYLSLLAQMTRLLKKPDFVKKLSGAASPDDIINAFKTVEG